MSVIESIHPGDRLVIDPVVSGLAHGFGIFETMRLSCGRLEFWPAHWQRLLRSAEALGLNFPFAEEDVLARIRELGKELGAEALIKLSLLREGEESRLLVYSRPFFPMPVEIGLLVDTEMPINERSPLAGHKTHNYMENMLACERARAAACFDTVRTDTAGHVAEASMANLFFIKNGHLKTPSEETGLLPGVVRSELIAHSQLEVEMGEYSIDELQEAEFVFLTNSTHRYLQVDWLEIRGQRHALPGANDSVCARIPDFLAARAIESSVLL